MFVLEHASDPIPQTIPLEVTEERHQEVMQVIMRSLPPFPTTTYYTLIFGFASFVGGWRRFGAVRLVLALCVSIPRFL